MEKIFGKVNVFFLTVFIIAYHFPKSKRFLLKSKKNLCTSESKKRPRVHKVSHEDFQPTAVSSAILIISLNVVCRSSAVHFSPVTRWSLTVKSASACRPYFAASV